RAAPRAHPPRHRSRPAPRTPPRRRAATRPRTPLPPSRADARHSRGGASRGFKATSRPRGRRAAPSARAPRSALDLRVVVHDAEDAAAAVAVTGQRAVAVDLVAIGAAAVDKLAYV